MSTESIKYTMAVDTTDIYPAGYEIPKGFKFVRFGCPHVGEIYICQHPRVVSNVTVVAPDTMYAPRVIVEKIPVVSHYVLTVEVEGDNVDTPAAFDVYQVLPSRARQRATVIKTTKV